MPYGKRCGSEAHLIPKAWHAARRPCSIEVEDVPRRVDVRLGGLEDLIDPKTAALVRLQPRGRQVEVRGRPDTTDGVQDHLRDDQLARLQYGHRPPGSFEPDRGNFFVQAEGAIHVAHLVGQRLYDLG